MRKKVLEYVEMVEGERGERAYRCIKCGGVLGPADRDFKHYALKRERPYSELLKARLVARDSDRFIFREFYCPSCGAMLDVENVLKGEPHLEIQIAP